VKIVHIVHQYPPEFRGGTEACVQSLTEAQRNRGDEPFIVAGSDERSALGELRLEAVDHVPVCRVLRRHGENYSMDNRLPRVTAQVLELVAGEQPDVVHLHHTLNLSGDLAAALTAAGHCVVASLHDFTTVCARFFLTRPDGSSCAESFPLPSDRCLACVLPDFPGGEEALAVELAARKQVAQREAESWALAVVPSEIVAKRWRASGLVPDERLVVLPHAVALASSDPKPPRDRSDGRLHLVTWGHLAPAKGVLDLLAALRLAADPRLSLLILGAPIDADYAELLLDAAEGLDVSFAGAYQPGDLPLIVDRVDLAVFPSRAEETFGLVVAEARALGLPVITSDRGALPESLGAAGITVPAADSPALAQLLRELADDGSRLAEWRRRARSDLHDPASHAEKMAARYAQALAGHQQGERS
jgi:glycosyltransferase involved in cell wall biosynthesis